jgi:hypothetical protein
MQNIHDEYGKTDGVLTFFGNGSKRVSLQNTCRFGMSRIFVF